MPMLLPLLPALIGAGSSIAGGMLSGGRQQQQTNTPSYTPDQMGIQGQLADLIHQHLSNPGMQLDPLRAQATGQINRNSASLQDRMQQYLTSRGFGRSGKVGTNLQQIEFQRQGQLGGLESNLAGMQLDQNNRDMDMAQRFGFENPTRTQTGSGQGMGAGAAAGGIGYLSNLFTRLQGGGSLRGILGGERPGSDGGYYGPVSNWDYSSGE